MENLAPSCNLPIIELILYYSTLSSYYYNYHTLNHSKTAEIDERKRAINGSSKVNVDPRCFYNVPIYLSYHRAINYLKSSHFKSLSIDKFKTEITPTLEVNWVKPINRPIIRSKFDEKFKITSTFLALKQTLLKQKLANTHN